MSVREYDRNNLDSAHVITLHATQSFFSEQKLLKQHGTIKTYLEIQREQHQF